MRKKVISLFTLVVLGAMLFIAPFTFNREIEDVRAEEYHTLLPQAGTNFRLAEVSDVDYAGLGVIIDIHNLVRDFWSPYSISLDGSSSVNSFSNFTNHVYVDLFFGYGFGYLQTTPSGDDYADGTVYTLEIFYDYTGSYGYYAHVQMYGDGGIPYLNCYYNTDQSVRLESHYPLPDHDLYLLNYQAYLKVEDSGFTGRKFVIPADYSLSSSSISSSDRRNLTNYIYTYLAFKLTWTTTYSSSSGSGGSGSSSDSFQQGYNSGYTLGYNDGKTVGKTEGYNDGKTVGKTEGYNEGYDEGKSAGITEGYDNGYKEGYNKGYTSLVMSDSVDRAFFTKIKLDSFIYDDNSVINPNLQYTPTYDDSGFLDFSKYLSTYEERGDARLYRSYITVYCNAFNPFDDSVYIVIPSDTYLYDIYCTTSSGQKFTPSRSDYGVLDFKNSNYNTNESIVSITLVISKADGLSEFRLYKMSSSFSYGYDFGFDDGYSYADKTVVPQAYANGLIDGSSNNLTTNWFASFLSGFSKILTINLFGGIQLWHLVAIPLLLGSIFLIFKFIK